jgi:threonine dehydratase
MGDPSQAHIFVGVQVMSDEDRHQLVADLKGKGYPLVDMTDNEIAKLHIRHMVGGRAVEATNEVVYRFEFPERPGALMQFLDKLGGRWNISMFHYRNHGAAYGRILAGLQVTAGERKKVAAFLNDLGYNWVEETDNPAYQVFLK